MVQRTVFRRRGNAVTMKDNDRMLSHGQRHYAQLKKWRTPVQTNPVNTEVVPRSTLIIPPPDPTAELFYVLIWLKHPLEQSRLQDLQNHLKRRLFVVDEHCRMILIESMQKADFPKFNFASNRYTIVEYQANDLPFEPLPEPFMPS